MKTRLHALDRLRALYGVVTHMREIALEQAAASVRDAEDRIDVQQKSAVLSSIAGLAALRDADRPEYLMHELQRDLSAQNAEWLGEVRDERAVASRAAAELYRANRLQLEQMQSVLKGLRSVEERERAHGEQRDADDQFLSRQRWRERWNSQL